MTHRAMLWTIAVSLACGACKRESASGNEQGQPAASSAGPSSPTKPAAKPRAAKKASPASADMGDVTATKIKSSLDDLTADDIKAALKAGGWSTKGSTVSKSPPDKAKKWKSIRVKAKKGRASAEVLWFLGEDSWKREDIEKKGGAYHQVKDDVFLGVTIRGNQKASKQLLDSLVGA